MAKPIYRLQANVFGHTSDVRALTTLDDGSIVSASRDNTARIWKPNGDGKNYSESAVLKGHTNFVSSVCAINPSNRYPKGFIITGSNDKTICIYAINETEPLHTIVAHSETVCNLKTGLKEEGTFFSSSWDKTAKLWNVDNLVKPQLTLKGHTLAVWCAGDLSNGLIVTGSADKLIIVWSRKGDILFKLTGHTDCVREFVAIKEDEFLSCANDATVCHWKASLGTCLGSYSGHNNYIYSIAATPNGTYTFTCSEDKTVKIWYNGNIQQTLTLPCQTIWCIDLLKNNDIVTGASDGTIRIFTSDPERQADEETLKQYEKEVEVVELNSQVELGGIKIKDLPDSTALREPGKTDGQIKMIRENNVVKAYSWSQSQHQWTLVGDVMGGSGGTTATSGKQLYNGVEYDYIFSIDIQDGIPPLKLPYNMDQDPWHVAQKFLHDNNLSQLFLEQVANFIVKNSQQSTSTLSSDIQYSDPFTGGSRYISNSGGNSINSTATTQNTLLNTSIRSQSYIPHKKYLRLEQANIAAILDKLRELNANQNKINQIADEQLECLAQSMKNSPSQRVPIEIINTLNTLLSWPSEVLFPVLDVTRLIVLQKEVNEQLCTSHLFQIIKKHLKPDAMASNQMLTYRLLANMFCHEKGETLGLDSKDEILQTLLDLSSLGNKNNQVAISTYILNLIIALNKKNDTSNGTKVLNVIFAALPRFNESEAIFRILVGLGTLLSASYSTENRNQLIDAVRQSETAVSVLRTLSETTTQPNSQNKLADCSKEIIDLIL